MAADTLLPGQVVVGAAVVGFAFLSVLAVILLVAMVIAVVQWWRARQHDVGPDSLRLLEDLDAHLEERFAPLAHLYERIGPPTPDLTGLSRLSAAVRDEQQEGEPS